MTPEVFGQVLAFLRRSEVSEVRLLGGEPTLHTDFPRLLRMALEQQQRVLVFSSGLIPEPALEAICRVSARRCRVMLNLNAPHQRVAGETARQQQVLRALGRRVMLAFTIQGLPLEMDFLLEQLRQGDAERRIRVGLAHPAAPGEPPPLPPALFPAVGGRLMRFARLAARQDVRLELDCGFVRCMFNDEELDELSQLGARARFCCTPVLDIDPDLQVHHCLPLAGRWPLALKHPAGDGAARRLQTRAGLAAKLEQRRRLYRQVGLYRECGACRQRQRGRCSGGCLASVLGRMRPADFTIRVHPAQSPPGGDHA